MIEAKSKGVMPARRSVKISSKISKRLSCDLRCLSEREKSWVSCLFEKLDVTSGDVRFLEIRVIVSPLKESSCSLVKRSTASYYCSLSSLLS